MCRGVLAAHFLQWCAGWPLLVVLVARWRRCWRDGGAVGACARSGMLQWLCCALVLRCYANHSLHLWLSPVLLALSLLLFCSVLLLVAVDFRGVCWAESDSVAGTAIYISKHSSESQVVVSEVAVQ